MGGDALIPPSSGIAAAVMNRLSSLARKSTAAAISSAVAWRPSGIIDSKISAARASPSPVATVSIRCWKALSTGPGWMELTRIPRSATSFAAVRITPTSACLDVA